MEQMKKQYLLKVQFASQVDDGEWWIGARMDPMAKVGQNYYGSLEEAKRGLNRLMNKFNREFVYDANGQRRETNEIGGGFAADMVLNKEIDDMNRIVHWSIQEREVTPWRFVDVDDERKEEKLK